jgi:predicted glycosyltransferase
MLVVTGPRISSELEAPEGVEVLRYVHGLYRHLAACDIAVVQGGLTTSMELTANRRPFIYVPLKNHFEQQVHVAHRLERYRAGRRMEFDEIDPASLATALIEELSKTPDYLPVERDGANNAATMIAERLGIG